MALNHGLLRGAVVAVILVVDSAAPTPSTFAVQLEKRESTNVHRRRLSAGAVAVSDCENVEYTGMIGLGTPIQEFRVVLSVASSDLWVANTECTTCESSSGGYDASRSSTHEVVEGSDFTIPGPSGEVEAKGTLSADVLTMGGVSTAVTFGEATEANLQGCAEVDGVMGMGLTNEDESNAFEDMVEAGAVEVPIFSFFMGNIDTNSPNGVLTLGGVNQTHYEGCLEWMPVSEAQDETSDLPGSVPDGFWSVVLKDLKVGSDSVLRSEATAVLDTGTSLIEGPFDDVGALAGKIGATCVRFTDTSQSQIEFVDCVDEASLIELIFMECEAEFGDINFYFGGEDFALTSKELLQPISDFEGPNPSTAADPLCLFGMSGADMVDTWVLGDPFLRTFYTSYNVADKTVGVAQATNSRTSSECDADASIGSAPANSGGGDGDEIGGPSVGGDVGGESMSVVAVGVVAGLATMAMISCGVVVFAVRQRFSKAGGAYRPAVNDIDGGGGGGGSGFEMSSGGNESVRHGGFEREGDFLQASPRPGVSSSGSGGRGAKRGVFGGLFGPPPTRAGFAAFENAD